MVIRKSALSLSTVVWSAYFITGACRKLFVKGEEQQSSSKQTYNYCQCSQAVEPESNRLRSVYRSSRVARDLDACAAAGLQGREI